jgi:hypothetical protein
MRRLLLLLVVAGGLAASIAALPGTAKADFGTCTNSNVFCGWKDHGYVGMRWEWGTSAMYSCPLTTWCFFADPPNDNLSSAYNNRSSTNKYDTILGKDRVIGGGLTHCFNWGTPYSDFNNIGFNDVASSIYLSTSPSLC